MNKIILIGLGNPGQQYHFSRHNVGFMVLDRILSETAEWKTRTNPDYQTAIFQLATINQGDQKDQAIQANQIELHLFKPETFMNKSGLVARKILKTYPQVAMQNWFVVHDDLDIKLGAYKIEQGKGPKDHNGLTSIYKQLQTSDFWHVRVGIDGRAGIRSVSGSDYVLQSFPLAERKILDETIEKIYIDLLNRLKICYH